MRQTVIETWFFRGKKVVDCTIFVTRIIIPRPKDDKEKAGCYISIKGPYFMCLFSKKKTMKL